MFIQRFTDLQYNKLKSLEVMKSINENCHKVGFKDDWDDEVVINVVIRVVMKVVIKVMIKC